MLAVADERAAGCRRGPQEQEQQPRMAPEIPDQGEVALVLVRARRGRATVGIAKLRPARLGQRKIVMDAGDDLHAAAVAMRQPVAVDGLHAPDVGAAVPCQRDQVIGRQLARHARAPEQLVAELPVDSLVQLGQLLQAGLDAGVHAGDQLELGLAEVRGDVRVRKRGAEPGRMRRGRERAIGIDAQAFLFDAAQEALEHFGGKQLYALLEAGQANFSGSASDWLARVDWVVGRGAAVASRTVVSLRRAG